MFVLLLSVRFLFRAEGFFAVVCLALILLCDGRDSCGDKGKRPVVRTTGLFYMLLYLHGCSTHDYCCLELHHHHAEDTNVVIVSCFLFVVLLIRLQK